MQPRKLSEKAFELAKAWEGLSLKAYQDSKGVWTIGYGWTRGVYPGQVWTAAQAEANLRSELQGYADKIAVYLRPDTTDDELAAFAVFAWNVGTAGAAGSQAVKAHNARNPAGVLASLLSWTTVTINGKRVKNYPGLVRRRRGEWTLYSTGRVIHP